MNEPTIRDNEVTEGVATGRGQIEVEVYAPVEPAPKHFTFSVNVLVGVAAQEAATAFGYGPGKPTFQIEDGAALDRSMTLEQAGVRDGDKLELVDASGGV